MYKYLGLGLPNADNDPYNENQGNCLGEYSSFFRWMICKSFLNQKHTDIHIRNATRIYTSNPYKDYTDEPSENVLPGEVNLMKLQNMYLTRRLRRVKKDGTIVERIEVIRR